MAIPSPNTTLSANDARILSALFDPETLPSSVSATRNLSAIDSSLPTHPSIPSERLSELEARQNELVKRTAKASGEDGEKILDAVEDELNKIISQEPEYPSAYLNRAMVRRMRLENSLPSPSCSSSDSDSPEPSSAQTIFASCSEESLNQIFDDLSKAITLSSPASQHQPVSTYQARILRTAYSHRAYLYLKASESGSGNGRLWRNKSKTDLEELASRDFSLAAKYGDEVAREMSVRTNPYAKMCGAIVRNALKEERGEV